MTNGPVGQAGMMFFMFKATKKLGRFLEFQKMDA
jgi:hypothetical protein